MSKYSFRLKIILAFMAAAILPFTLYWFLILANHNETNTLFILIMIFSIFFALLLSLYLSRSIIKPLNKITKAAQIISEGNLDYDIPVEGDDEIGFLAQCIRKMLVGLKATYLMLKKRTRELMESNEQLQDMNLELEASLEQLKATTQQLNESEEKYRNLVENMTDMVWLVDYRIDPLILDKNSRILSFS